ncbi:hypothetical protein ACHQM5_000286 [Ranunculus cassubicifolius]
MAYSSVSISSTTMAKDIYKERNILRRSQSCKDLCEADSMRRSHSDPQLRMQATSTEPKLKTSHSFKNPFHISSSGLSSSVKSFLVEQEMDNYVELEREEEEELASEQYEKRNNWLAMVLEVRGNWKNRNPKDQLNQEGDENEDEDEFDGGCEVEYEVEEEEVYDSVKFNKLLRRARWPVTKLFSQLSFLCNLAYVIPEIKPEDLRKYYDLQYVTSSLDKKDDAAIKVKLEQDSTRVPISSAPIESDLKNSKPKIHIRPSVAYDIAASAASYLHSTAKGLLALGQKSDPDQENGLTREDQNGSREKENISCNSFPSPYPSRVYNSKVAAHVATSTMTAVVGAEEAVKEKAAKELQSLDFTPCDWFICDDKSNYTRCFVIQGSDSSASWKANLLFEPTKFEGTDVLVHRGIYEAAKGIYEQFMPEIEKHLETYGDRAKLRFTGHSLGGSLSLLVSLMLLTRKKVKTSNLLPVVTFGSPFIFCGGRTILEMLGLDESHIQSVMMHRDIVPRAFSCNYPKQIAQILKRINSTFKSHPCLNRNKMLYTPLGQLYILQPDEKCSPSHPLLPPGSALYEFNKSKSSCYAGVASALRAFLNAPHPLETLSDPTAYGSEGTILRDHDSSNYLKAVNNVLREHTKAMMRESRRERLNRVWPHLTDSQSAHTWNHQQNLANLGLAKNKVATHV